MVSRFWRPSLSSVIVIVALIALFALPAFAEVPYRSYIYDYWKHARPAPQAYLSERIVTGRSLGLSDFNKPDDVFVDSNQTVYIVDTGNSRIVHTDSEFNLIRVIAEFGKNGSADRLRNPSGVFVDKLGQIYIADTGNQRIVVLDENARFLKQIDSPKPTGDSQIADNFAFIPLKLVVDHFGNLLVVVKDVYEGLMQFNPAGEFTGYVGAPRVSPSLVDVLWSRIATEEQRRRQAIYLPTEFSNVALDERGFVLATVKGSAAKDQNVNFLLKLLFRDRYSTTSDSVRRLNLSGKDVLRRLGYGAPAGDIGEPDQAATFRFVDVTARGSGSYSLLEQTRGRVFTYDVNGRLLYVFGSIGDQVGTFRSPVSIESVGNRVIVLDNATNSITVFSPTHYADLIHLAMQLYGSGMYDESARTWAEVGRLSVNYAMAYTGMGAAAFMKGDYETAMRYFYLGNNRDDYSKAFAEYRKEMVSKYFGRVMGGFILLIVVILVVMRLVRRRAPASAQLEQAETPDPLAEYWVIGPKPRIRKHNLVGQTLKGLRFALHLIFHPIDSFWYLKFNRLNGLPAAILLLILACAAVIFRRQYTDFIFNTRDIQRMNIYIELARVLVPFILWAVVNWALTTLMDGKGTFRDIVVLTAFSLVPIILAAVPATLVSHVLIKEERMFLTLINQIGTFWSLTLIVIGTMVTHEYSLPKTVWSSVVTVLGMGAMIFIGLLFSTVVGRVVGFVSDVYREIIYKL